MAPHLDSINDMIINEYWTGKDAEGSAGRGGLHHYECQVSLDKHVGQQNTEIHTNNVVYNTHSFNACKLGTDMR